VSRDERKLRMRAQVEVRQEPRRMQAIGVVPAVTREIARIHAVWVKRPIIARQRTEH